MFNFKKRKQQIEQAKEEAALKEIKESNEAQKKIDDAKKKLDELLAEPISNFEKLKRLGSIPIDASGHTRTALENLTTEVFESVRHKTIPQLSVEELAFVLRVIDSKQRPRMHHRDAIDLMARGAFTT